MNSGYPEEAVAWYRAAFEMFDPEGKGKVSVQDFRSFLETALGPSLKQEESDAIVECMDPDEEGMIDFQAFMTGFSSKLFAQENQEELYKAFLRGSPDALNGLIDWGAALGRLGLNLPPSEVENIMYQAQASARELLAIEMRRSGINPRKIEEEVLRERQELGDVIPNMLVASNEDLSVLRTDEEISLPEGEITVAPTPNEGDVTDEQTPNE